MKKAKVQAYIKESTKKALLDKAKVEDRSESYIAGAILDEAMKAEAMKECDHDFSGKRLINPLDPNSPMEAVCLKCGIANYKKALV